MKVVGTDVVLKSKYYITTPADVVSKIRIFHFIIFNVQEFWNVGLGKDTLIPSKGITLGKRSPRLDS